VTVVGHCETCKWWSPPKGTAFSYGHCGAVSVKGDDWPHSPCDHLARCTGSYDSGCVPDNMDLLTKADFGCVLHEPKA
jgi:hypothetical protein